MKMCRLYRSDTGTFVLVHEASGTTVTGDDVNALYDKLLERIPDGATAAAPSAVRDAWPRRGMVIGLLAIALLPFLWLSVLHYTLGRLIDDRSVAAASDAASPADAVAEEAAMLEIRQLQKDVSRLEKLVSKQGSKDKDKDKDHGRERRTTLPLAPGQPGADDGKTADDGKAATDGKAADDGKAPSPDDGGDDDDDDDDTP